MVTDRPADATGGDRPRLRADDRAVSITVTHVLTIGITTILVAGLLIGAGNMLDAQSDRSIDRSLEIIGERLAGEISHADHLADGDEVNVTAEHPRRIGGSQYTVELLDADGCEAPLIDDGDACLRLATTDDESVVYVPVSVEVAENSSAPGGTIIVSNDGNGVELGEP